MNIEQFKRLVDEVFEWMVLTMVMAIMWFLIAAFIIVTFTGCSVPTPSPVAYTAPPMPQAKAAMHGPHLLSTVQPKEPLRFALTNGNRIGESHDLTSWTWWHLSCPVGVTVEVSYPVMAGTLFLIKQ